MFGKTTMAIDSTEFGRPDLFNSVPGFQRACNFWASDRCIAEEACCIRNLSTFSANCLFSHLGQLAGNRGGHTDLAMPWQCHEQVHRCRGAGSDRPHLHGARHRRRAVRGRACEISLGHSRVHHASTDEQMEATCGGTVTVMTLHCLFLE